MIKTMTTTLSKNPYFMRIETPRSTTQITKFNQIKWRDSTYTVDDDQKALRLSKSQQAKEVSVSGLTFLTELVSPACNIFSI
jgi:hypothetical protein